ncbi:MAG: DUF3370 domain-containing protein [Gloeomargaritaceae cyanobacterium C42_A2020_066]|nr:DUF3370 domain-containing protein [Gloeomargaritaceae cyanobacterium C42_A2020_066]
MIPWLPLLAQVSPEVFPEPVPRFRTQEVRPLPGGLDTVPVFNSNSPELVLQEGILLSTFGPAGRRHPEAHLNYTFQGRFDLFAHHIADGQVPLYLGILVGNPGSRPAVVSIRQGASFLTQPDAPFVTLPPVVGNPLGAVFSGPGSRAMDAVLRGRRPADWPQRVEVAPGETQLLFLWPIPVGRDRPSRNGRSALVRLWSSQPVQMASLALHAVQDEQGQWQPPPLAAWQALLDGGQLAGPRDRVPTPPNQATQTLIYGRVAGVGIGSRWQALVTDRGRPTLSLPDPGRPLSYGLSLLQGNTQGTGQIQTAPLIRRYADTAYAAHGNYAIEYALTLPLLNASPQPRAVTLSLDSPLKQDTSQGGLTFLEPPPRQVFFRGTVRLRYRDDAGLPQTRYQHLVLRRGQSGDPLLTLTLPPGGRRLVQVDLLYPPDATPPQVLTLRSEDVGQE